FQQHDDLPLERSCDVICRTEWRRVSRGTRVSLLTSVQLTQDQIGISATSLPQIRYSNVRSKLEEMT
ncbi:hypothetical protein ACCS96_19705, partial [Rhizobium ruizarguesonis]